MTRTLYLARHGETAWNAERRWQGQTDIPLSDEGRRQARLLATRLRGRGIVRVHTSDLARARETAEIVAAELGLPEVVADPDLRERAFGPFEGKTAQECEATLGEAWRIYQADRLCLPAGAEPEAEVVARMGRAVRRATEALAHEDAAVLLVSHGSALRSLLGSLAGLPTPLLGNGAVFRLVLDGARARQCQPVA